ncbi:MAG: DUF996 domain-containing protein [Acidilobaceae archaeon]
MIDFDTGRTLGLAGSILVLVAIIFSFIIDPLGFLLQLVGLILILVSLHAFSNIYGERSIFRDALLSVLIGYGLSLVASIILLILFGFTILTTRPILPGRIEDLFGAQIEGELVALIVIMFLALLIAFVVSAYLWYRALNTLYLRSGEKLFRWAGLSYLAFAVSLIVGLVTAVILVGLLVILVGILLGLASWVLLAIAFYNVKPPQPTIEAEAAPTPAVQV